MHMCTSQHSAIITPGRSCMGHSPIIAVHAEIKSLISENANENTIYTSVPVL